MCLFINFALNNPIRGKLLFIITPAKSQVAITKLLPNVTAFVEFVEISDHTNQIYNQFYGVILGKKA